MKPEQMKCKTKEIVDYLKANGPTLHEDLFLATGGYQYLGVWWTAAWNAAESGTIELIHGARWELTRGSDPLDPDFTPEPLDNLTPCTIDPAEV